MTDTTEAADDREARHEAAQQARRLLAPTHVRVDASDVAELAEWLLSGTVALGPIGATVEQTAQLFRIAFIVNDGDELPADVREKYDRGEVDVVWRPRAASVMPEPPPTNHQTLSRWAELVAGAAGATPNDQQRDLLRGCSDWLFKYRNTVQLERP
jgi:hypothetical protein